MRIKVSDYIAQLTAQLGIERVFTVTGGGAMHLNDAFGHSESLKCIYNCLLYTSPSPRDS